jgi:membrane-bound metal-dependent hydrolase YbcI (DUF457 family)
VPDLTTHLAGGYLLALPQWQRRRFRLFFLLGSLLPDLLTRPFYVLFPGTFDAVAPFHTPVGYLFAVGLLVQLYEEVALRRSAFRALLAGGALHFLLDAPQRHLYDGYRWLFPFSDWSYSWGLYWPGDSVVIAPLAALVVVAIELWSRRQRRS